MDNFGTSERLRRALILKTGQTTSYVTGDDGDLEKGEPHRYYVLSTGQHSGTTNITLGTKSEAHSNACVLDETTGLMWSRTVSASVGPNSNGTLPWTVNGSGEGIFEYAAAANAASLSGYTDWRVPNMLELASLLKMEQPSAIPDSTAFPSWPLTLWTTTSRANSATTYAMYIGFQTSECYFSLKTATIRCVLVRGPV